MRSKTPLPWLDSDDPFPAVSLAWPSNSGAPGLLAAGGDLSVPRLISAYRQGIFPWFSQRQPILWFSTDPRMVLRPEHFVMHHALRKTWRRLIREHRLSIDFNFDFDQVMHWCAQIPRTNQQGTWIGPDMIQAYNALHRAGHAKCIAARIDDQLVGGLYAVVLGRMVYGESMFSLRPNGSKLALAALVAWARHHGLSMIDCQQDTAHLRSLGGQTLSRADFLAEMHQLIDQPTPEWVFSPIFWSELRPETT